jgi:prepilin-type N-terminal cleavage/methylation domain-containing protein
MYIQKRQSGFTLVEIAIVLVIIGLLLGGILKGQQLINSARVRNMADQNSGVQAAYYGFIDRYRQVPGDMPAATACQVITAQIAAWGCGVAPVIGGTVGANGQNGRIDTWAEAGAVWAHLSGADFLNGSFSGATVAQANYEIAVPINGVPGNAFQAPILLGNTDDYENNALAATTVRLSYIFGAGSSANLLRELDVKLDDGSPGTGVVRSTLRAANAGAGEAALGGGTDFAGGAAGSEVITWAAGFGVPCLADNVGAAVADNTANAFWNVDSDNTRCNALFLY